jgi:hypothetical protein
LKIEVRIFLNTLLESGFMSAIMRVLATSNGYATHSVSAPIAAQTSTFESVYEKGFSFLENFYNFLVTGVLNIKTDNSRVGYASNLARKPR